MTFTTKPTTLTRQVNNFARRFNTIAEAHGFDLPLEVLMPLVELFGEALQTLPDEVFAVALGIERAQGGERATKASVLSDPIPAAAPAPQDPPVYCRSCDHTHLVGAACWFRETAGASGIPPPPPENQK